jgi:hypothetical protein
MIKGGSCAIEGFGFKVSPINFHFSSPTEVEVTN